MPTSAGHPVTDEVRNALVEATTREQVARYKIEYPLADVLTSQGVPQIDAEAAVDTVLAHLEQVGWWGSSEPELFSPRLWELHSNEGVDCAPVYRLKV